MLQKTLTWSVSDNLLGSQFLLGGNIPGLEIPWGRQRRWIDSSGTCLTNCVTSFTPRVSGHFNHAHLKIWRVSLNLSRPPGPISLRRTLHISTNVCSEQWLANGDRHQSGRTGREGHSGGREGREGGKGQTSAGGEDDSRRRENTGLVRNKHNKFLLF